MNAQDHKISNDAGWQDWNGGACPVPAGSMVEARLRYAGIVSRRADSLMWHHNQYVAYGAEDVIAYRVLP